MPALLHRTSPFTAIRTPPFNSRIMASKGSQNRLLSPSTAISGSENCNPNVISGSCKRKITKANTSEQFSESSSALKHLAGQSYAEFNLISPPRKHVCSSRRCASKNPDYAVPATVNPKRFLLSKRQVLPSTETTQCKCCLWKSKRANGAADDPNSRIKVCNRCSHELQNRRWSSDDSVSRHLAGNGEPTGFPLPSSELHRKTALQYHPDSAGQIQFCGQTSMDEAVCLHPASEILDQERFYTDSPTSWNRTNDRSNLQTHCVDTQDYQSETKSDRYQLKASISPAASASCDGGTCCGSESKNPEAPFSNCELQASPLLASKGLFHFEASCQKSPSERLTSAAGDDENHPKLTPEIEAAISPSPEKSGNWRLNAVLEAFGNLSPTREGRVKTLVRAFESLLSVKERKGEQLERKPRCRLKFSYLSSNANLDGEENTQREDFTDGGEGESEKDEVDAVEQWQTDSLKGDVKDYFQSPHPLRVNTQTVVKDEENHGMGEQEQENFESCEDVVIDEKENGMERALQDREAQEENAESVAHIELKGGIGDRWQLLVSNEKQWQLPEAEKKHAHSRMNQLSQQQKNEEILAHAVVEEDRQEEDKERKPHGKQAEGIYPVTLQKGDANSDKQPSDSVQSLQIVLTEGKAKKDSALQELQTRQVPALYINPSEAAFKRQTPNPTNLKQQSHQYQKFVDGQFLSIAARKQQNSRSRESRRGSNCSISSTRPTLTHKSQVQSAQDKPHLSKPQPFKLLTEVRGHMKEQEFLMRLRKILEEEEKLRVPLAQGLPWTTDEPNIPYKPPAKENTKPLDVLLNSDLRAMERADFDRFIAEKLLYIEERRLEEERLHRATEEEEIKRMRQDMVPKAQLMPYFDRPFRPRRSSKRPTIPKEPQFHVHKQQPKRQKCLATNSS